jgi:hypothetical protein
MALSASTLTSLIKSKLDALFGAPVDPAIQQQVIQAISEAVVEHIQSAAVVATTVSGNAVVAGGSSAGTWPVTGSGTGTVS